MWNCIVLGGEPRKASESESSSSEKFAAKRREVRFVALGGLERGRPVLVRRFPAAVWEVGLAGVRRDMPGVRGEGE